MVFFSPIRRIRNTKRKILRKKFDYVYLQWPDEFTNRIPKGKPFLQSLVFPEINFSLEKFEEQIEKFSQSRKGKGLIIELPLSFYLPLGLIDQLHTILKPVKESGKELIIIAKIFDTRSYYFATIASKILLIPGGLFDVRGSARSILFMKNGLDKIGVEFEKVAVSGYKSAFDNFTRKDLSPEAKENIEWLLRGERDIIAKAVLESRNITDYEQLINNAPYTAEKAFELGYIDGIINTDQLPEYLTPETAKNKVKVIPFEKLHKFLFIKKEKSMNEVIAIIPVIGGIVDGVNSDSPLPLPVPIPLPLVDEQQTGDISIIQTIRNVLKDPTVVGTILFVDSPGGSVFASETIRSALMNLKKKMPLVAYFNSVSASGGYYISTPAQWIVSEPGAITGSIGVFNAKISMKGFIEKQQLNVETIKEGLRADWGNLYEPLSEEERNSSKELVDYHYQHFLSIVAENRNKSVEEIKDFAGGRVYLGTQAIENGLVDELGSLNKAKEKVCELAKKKASKIPLITFHPPKKMIAPLFVKNEKEFINKLVSKYNPYLKSNYWFRDFSMDYK